MTIEKELQKKLREARKEIRELRDEKFFSDKAQEYLTNVLSRYDESSWNFDKNRLHETLVVLRGIFDGEW